MKKILIAIYLIAFCAHSAWATGKIDSKSRWVGMVTHVSDGDTLWVRAAGVPEPVKIRIEGLDAPEICQTYGDISRAALASLVLHQVVVVQGRRRDSYGRVLARLSVHGDDVGSTLVAQGHAWSYHYRKDAGPYATQEAHAMAARRGLFADAGAQEPRVFRKRHGTCH
jgi:micrococcal nuclease